MATTHRSLRPVQRCLRATAVAGTALISAGALTACSALGSLTTESNDTATGFFSLDAVNSISITVDDGDLQELLDTYDTSNDKEWATATVTINGETFTDVGLRLKGNSSLRSVSTEEGLENPQDLPWLIRLDKYVDGQTYEGRSDFVVRSNNTATSLNEAVALEVLSLADVPSVTSGFSRVSVNGGQETLRLVVDLPDDDAWVTDSLIDTGVLYKANSDGDYSYRGDNGEDYTEAFDIKSITSGLSEQDGYSPLIEFLDVVNNSDDDQFATQLAEYLDVEEFARYLAVQDLVANTDDIDGPGNNSYLYYNDATGQMTVVAWDQNLSFGGMGMGGFGGGRSEGEDGLRPDDDTALPSQEGGTRPEVPEGFTPPEGGLEDLPEGMSLPEGFTPPDGENMPEGGGPGGGRGGMGKENALVTRFLENEDFNALYTEATSTLQADIYDSGAAQEFLDAATELLASEASDLVTADDISTDSSAIQRYFTAESATSTPGSTQNQGNTRREEEKTTT